MASYFDLTVVARFAFDPRLALTHAGLAEHDL